MFLRPLQENREHVASYYAATLGEHTTYPTLTERIDTDVCVIGGGFSGISTALHLAERGYRVVVLEGSRIGWGATGRNGGQLIGGFSMDADDLRKDLGADGAREVWRMGQEGVNIIRQRVASYGIDCDLRFGYCDVALKPRDLVGFEADLRRQQELGYPHAMRLVARDELRTLIKSDLYLGGMLNEGYGQLHPLKLCLGEARAAASLGVQIFEQTRATKLEQGECPVVHTEQGVVHAKYLAVCGDAYLGELVPQLSSRNLPAASFVIATAPLGERTQDVMTRELAVCDTRWALDYYRLSVDGRLVFGGACNYTGLAPANVTETMRQKMRKVFPQLHDVAIDYTWGGQIGISMNRIPQLGRLQGNVFFAQGYSGHGVAPTHLMGKLLAEAIAGQAERFDLFARYKHLPFPGGKWMRQPLYALGMLYYRTRDWL